MANKSLTKSSQQLHLQKILIKNFDNLKEKNNSYSLRSYARKLGLSPTALSEMIHAKRLITRKTIVKMLNALEISSADKAKIIQHEKSKSAFEFVEKKYVTIDMQAHPILSEWHYFAILSLTEVVDFKSDARWIAERLNISLALAHRSLKKLLELGVLVEDSSGNYVATGVSFRIEADISKTFYLKTHLDNLHLAKKAIETLTNREHANFSSMTMSIDRELLPDAKALIQDFRRKLAHFLESGKREEVYKLNIQLFPVNPATK